METRNFGMELRTRLVREVAAPYFESVAEGINETAILCEIKEIENLIEKSSKDFSTKMLESVKESWREEDVLKERNDFLAWNRDQEGRMKVLQDSLECKKTLHVTLIQKSQNALRRIANEILAGNFGRGELQLNCSELTRVFGRLDESESKSHFGLIIRNNINSIGNQIKQLSEACRDGIPLVHVDVDLMPMESDEIFKLCRKESEYFLLKKFIPSNLIPWESHFVYRIRKEQDYDIYSVILSGGVGVVVKVEKETYPKYVLTALGTMTQRDDCLIENELKYWDGCRKVEWHDGTKKMPWPIVACGKNETNAALITLLSHLNEKYPGIMCQCPQMGE